MEPRDFLGLLLFLHIAGSIIAFGPTYAFSIIGGMGGRDPSHANFATRVSYAISTRLVFPAALFVGLTGVGLIWAGGWDITRQSWLAASVGLYGVAIGISLFVAMPTTRRIIEATSGGPPPAPSGPPSAEEPAARPAGPPPNVAALVTRSKRIGLVLAGLVLVVLALMVFKPAL